jgi:hypothetical protein
MHGQAESAGVLTPASPVREREREGEGGREREGGRKREREREKEREKERERVVMFLYFVNKSSIINLIYSK